MKSIPIGHLLWDYIFRMHGREQLKVENKELAITNVK